MVPRVESTELVTGKPELEPRVSPTQRRAVATVDRILEAAGSLIEETGLEGFNTNVLAERAGVAVRSVYRYFPNKFAVLAALAERQARPWDRAFDRFVGELANPQLDAVEAWGRLLDSWVGLEDSDRTIGTVWAALKTQPELASVYQREYDRLAASFAEAMRARGCHLQQDRLKVIGEVLVQITDTVLDYSLFRFGRVTEEARDELRRLTEPYLRGYVG